MAEMNRAVILAAGPGSRLTWLTRHRPKALMDVAGEATIVRIIRKLVSQGIRDMAINIHHHGDQLIKALGDGSQFGVRLYFSHEEKVLDSGGGVRQALDLLPGKGLLAVHNADVLSGINVQTLAGRCPDAGACLGLVNNPEHHPGGDFSLHGGLVLPGSRAHPGYTFSGVSVWDQCAFDAWSPGQVFPLTDVIRSLGNVHRCAGMLYDGPWLDVGRPRDVVQARRWAHTQARTRQDGT